MSLSQLVNHTLLEQMDLVQKIVDLGLSLRGTTKIKIKQPLLQMTINYPVASTYIPIILEELNIKNLVVDPSLTTKIRQLCIPNAKIVGKRLWSRFAHINTLAKSWQFVLQDDGCIQIEDIVLTPDEYEMRYETGDLEGDLLTSGSLVILLDTTMTPALQMEGYAREIVRCIQEARKAAGYQVMDHIVLSLTGDQSDEIIWQFGGYIASETLATRGTVATPDITKTLPLDTTTLMIALQKSSAN